MRVSLSRKATVEPESSQPKRAGRSSRGLSWLSYYRDDSPSFTGSTASLPCRQLPCEP